MSHSPAATELAERAARILPGGATHAARAYQPAMYVARSQGARKWLVDGREVVDYTMGHGALLLGHAHPAVVEAVQQQVARGTHYGAASPLEVEWAELVCRLVDSVEQLRFTASGTEAGMLAARLARDATGRDLLLKLDDHFHGWYDAVTVNLDHNGRVAAAGVPDGVAAFTRVVHAGDLDALRDALADRRVAAMFIEASGAHYGRVPMDPQYVRAAAALCAEFGTLFVVDEVVTGFRVAPGGIQSTIGVRPDLSTFGKIMAGGLPGGAVGGRHDVMDLLRLSPPGSETEPAGPPHIAHPGTFNANPLTAAAGIATLQLVADGTAQRTADAYAQRLETQIGEAFAAAGTSGRVWRLSSIVHFALDDAAQHARLGDALREQGVDMLRTSAFCSVVHGDAELEWTRAAFDRALAGLRR